MVYDGLVWDIMVTRQCLPVEWEFIQSDIGIPINQSRSFWIPHLYGIFPKITQRLHYRHDWNWISSGLHQSSYWTSSGQSFYLSTILLIKIALLLAWIPTVVGQHPQMSGPRLLLGPFEPPFEAYKINGECLYSQVLRSSSEMARKGGSYWEKRLMVKSGPWLTKHWGNIWNFFVGF